MAKLKTVADLLKLAILREKRACEFYRELAAGIPDRELAEVVLLMAQEELEHKGKLELELIKQGIVAKKIPQRVRLEIEDSADDTDPTGGIDYKDLMLVAIEKERTSFRLYALLAGALDDSEMQEALLALAEEEAKHVARFEQAYHEATSSRG